MNKNHEVINQLCAELGKDRLLVQGAGGNASWKESGVLWVKGSGTWLANANKEDIFVPVDLDHLQNALSQSIFEINPQVINNECEKNLRPSIETVLHALMPQKVVVHLHAVNALSHLVTKDCKTTLQELFTKTFNSYQVNSALVDYYMPGPLLAQAVHEALQSNTAANVIFLKNHGVVIGADSIEEIYALLKSINAICTPKKNPANSNYTIAFQARSSPEYIPFASSQAQALAFDPNLFKRLQSDWILFPDHAVFLGPKAFTYSSWEAFEEQEKNNSHKPDLIFIKNTGVFVMSSFNQAKTAQLFCYYDVISRVLPEAILDPLDEKSIYSLLNWDAEKFRQKISK